MATELSSFVQNKRWKAYFNQELKIIKQYKRVDYNMEQPVSLQNKHCLFILNWMAKAQTQ